METYMENYNAWLSDPAIDAVTKAELKSMRDNTKEIEDRFFRNLEFGTGGLRGVIGAGANRMNIYTVRKATQGLANYILKQGEGAKKMGVAIAYDSRRMSPEFANETALVLNGNGIKTYIYPELRPVALLSYAVRQLGATAGVVITASHNPPEYNGYKVYWSDGGQVPYPRDEAIIEEVNAVSFKDINITNKAAATSAGLYNVIGADMDTSYIAAIKRQTLNPGVIAKMADKINIVYTPLHGTGNKPVRRILKELGYTHVHVVPEQELPDGNFPTVSYPNPEDPKAFTLAMKLADEVNADVVIATDPDADRLGVVVKNSKGQYSILTGNMTGVLLTEYILSQHRVKGDLMRNSAVVSTIVSTDMTEQIVKEYGINYFNVLTGFKYIGEKIKEFEQTGSNQFIFGFEESYGCLAGTHARDKDAIVAVMLVCEMASYYKSKGMTLYDGLFELYKKYGFYMESIESVTLKGVEGIANIQKIMSKLRVSPPEIVNGAKVCEARDYKTGVIKNLDTGEEAPTNLPVSDVLYYVTEDGSWFCVRPSGTEPKIKVYFGVRDDNAADADAKLKAVTADVMKAVAI